VASILELGANRRAPHYYPYPISLLAFIPTAAMIFSFRIP
jgi:hypothetical protein